MPETCINTGFRHFCPLFKLAKFGLILVVLIQLSILFCINNSHLFYSLFFIPHIFSTDPVPLNIFFTLDGPSGLLIKSSTHPYTLHSSFSCFLTNFLTKFCTIYSSIYSWSAGSHYLF